MSDYDESRHGLEMSAHYNFLIMLMYDNDIGSKFAKTHFVVLSCLQSILYIKVPFRVFAEQVSV